LSREPVVPLDLTLQAVLVRSRRVRVAAMGSASAIFGLDEGEAALGRFGGVVQLCFDDACRSSVNTAANLVLAGRAARLGKRSGRHSSHEQSFAFLLELQSVLPISREGGEANVLAGAFGVRFSGKAWAVDIALEGPLDRRSTRRSSLCSSPAGVSSEARATSSLTWRIVRPAQDVADGPTTALIELDLPALQLEHVKVEEPSAEEHPTHGDPRFEIATGYLRCVIIRFPAGMPVPQSPCVV